MSPSKFTIVALSLALSMGCRYTEQKSLASGGPALPPSSGDDSDPSSSPDGDTGWTGEGSPPVIDSVEASWSQDQNGYWYIEASLTYTDEDDDVRTGGFVGVTLVVDDDTYAQEWFAIDGESAIHDDESNEVRFNPQPPDVSDPGDVSVDVTIQLKDAAENRSNEYPVTPE